MTFLSQFPRARAPPKGRISGVNPEPVVEQDTHFLVEVERDGIEPIVRIVDPEGRELEAQVQKANDSNRCFGVAYTPLKIGKHAVSLMQDISGIKGSDHRPRSAGPSKNQTWFFQRSGDPGTMPP